MDKKIKYKIDRLVDIKAFDIEKRFWHIPAIIFAAIAVGFSIKNFVNSQGLLPGGFTGLSLLIQELLRSCLKISVPFSAIYIPMNAIPVIVSFRYIGKRFTLLSVLMIVLTSIVSDVCPDFNITDDILLCALIGGCLSGVGVGICLLANATSGGTDFISIFISMKYGKDAWGYIFAGNVIVLLISSLVFGVNGAMYSIILQFVSMTVIQMMYRRFQKETLLVITEKPDEVYKTIKSLSNHDATCFRGVGMYAKKERTMLYSVLSSDEVSRVTQEIHKTDDKAFVNVLKSSQVSGQFYQRPYE